MKKRIHSKRVKIFTLAAFLSLNLTIGSFALADDLTNQQDLNIVDVAVNQQSIAVADSKSVETSLSSQKITTETIEKTPVQNKNIPAVTEPKTKQDDKNIIPVLELKGGVRQAEEESPIRAWLNGDYATGNWFGLRTKLEEHGINIQTTYLNDDYIKMRGGLNNKHRVKYLGVLDTNISIDTKKLGLWSGGEFFVDFQNKHGAGLTNNYLGDFQLYDNMDAPDFSQFSQYWYKQSLFGDKLSVKLGKQDAAFDFMALESGFNYINNSFSATPNVPMPIYPNPAVGVVTTISPTGWLTVRNGVYDGNAKGGTIGFDTAFDGHGGAMILNELQLSHNIKNYKGNYLLGYWLHTENWEELSAHNPRTFGQKTGWYMQGDQMIFKENSDSEDEQGLILTGQFSWAPSDRSEVARYYSAGMQYKGLIPKRNDDVAGIGAAFANFSDRLRAIDGRHGCETAIEWFYKIKVTPWLSMQPDMQFIYRPNGGGIKSGFVMGIRSIITF